MEAIKVATWWNTAGPVWLSGMLHGIPAYFVQDIETSYYPHHPRVRDAVLASYRPEFRFMTTSGWNRERLGELGVRCGSWRRAWIWRSVRVKGSCGVTIWSSRLAGPIR